MAMSHSQGEIDLAGSGGSFVLALGFGRTFSEGGSSRDDQPVGRVF